MTNAESEKLLYRFLVFHCISPNALLGFRSRWIAYRLTFLEFRRLKTFPWENDWCSTFHQKASSCLTDQYDEIAAYSSSFISYLVTCCTFFCFGSWDLHARKMSWLLWRNYTATSYCLFKVSSFYFSDFVKKIGRRKCLGSSQQHRRRFIEISSKGLLPSWQSKAIFQASREGTREVSF